MPTLTSVTWSCDPDRIFFQRPVVIEIEMIVVVIGVVVVLMHDVLRRADDRSELCRRLLVVGIGHRRSAPSFSATRTGLPLMPRKRASSARDRAIPRLGPRFRGAEQREVARLTNSLSPLLRYRAITCPSGRHLMHIPGGIPHRGEGRDRDPERHPERHGGRSLYLAAWRARHRIRVRQCRHRFRADRRGALPQRRRTAKFPRFITVPHENVAMAMAHGYYRICGKPAAVMVHVTVGTANAICGLMNAARDNIPVLLAAGRTPLTETGQHRLAQPADPLGPGGVRPGRHGARIRQMGLRAARRPAGRAPWSIARSTSR